MKKVVFKIEGMHCTSCAFNIDGQLEDKEGIKESTTNYAKSQTSVTFDDAQVTESDIVKIIKEVGYTATAL